MCDIPQKECKLRKEFSTAYFPFPVFCATDSFFVEILSVKDVNEDLKIYFITSDDILIRLNENI